MPALPTLTLAPPTPPVGDVPSPWGQPDSPRILHRVILRPKREISEISGGSSTSKISIGDIYAISPYGMNIHQFVMIVGFTPTRRPRVVRMTKIMQLGENCTYFVKPGSAVDETIYTFSKPINGIITIDEIKYFMTKDCKYDPNTVYVDLPPL
jgi:hypothetical protein